MPGLPPIPDVDTFNLGRLLLNIALAVVWTAVAGVCFALALALGLRLLAALLPELDYLGELKRGNVAVALVVSIVLISLTAVVVAILLK
jgi:hypothetical protein